MLKAPCKDCSDRHMECHISCPKYIEWKGEREKLNEKISAERNVRSEVKSYKDRRFGLVPFFKR